MHECCVNVWVLCMYVHMCASVFLTQFYNSKEREREREGGGREGGRDLTVTSFFL